MPLPIGAAARFVLKRLIIPAAGKAVAAGHIDVHTIKNALGDAIQDEAVRQAAKRAR